MWGFSECEAVEDSSDFSDVLEMMVRKEDEGSKGSPTRLLACPQRGTVLFSQHSSFH